MGSRRVKGRTILLKDTLGHWEGQNHRGLSWRKVRMEEAWPVTGIEIQPIKLLHLPFFKPERTGSWAELACKEWRDYYVRYVEAQTSLNIYCDSDFLCLISKGCPARFLSACYGWSFSACLSSRASVSIFLYMCPFVPVALFILSFSIPSSPSLVLPKDNKNDFLICFIYQTILCFILILKMSVSKLFLSLCLTKRTTKKLNWVTFDFCGLQLKFFLLLKTSSSCKRGRSFFPP